LMAPDRSIQYIKIDTEGGEFAVLDGMHELLLQRKVELMSWEYSFGWHKPLYYGEYNASHSYADCKRASPQLT